MIGDEIVLLEEEAASEENRAVIYRLLARFYRIEADEEFLDSLVSTAFPSCYDGGMMDEGLRQIVSYLDALWEQSLQELRVDFVRTFIGNGLDGFSAAYPYESVYTSPERLMMQDARDRMRGLLREEGLRKTEQYPEPEDHIALELEYMAHLCQKRAEALCAADKALAAGFAEKQRAMMRHHLLVWVPAFTEDAERFSGTEFYRGAARLTRGFLLADSGFLFGEGGLSGQDGPSGPCAESGEEGAS